MRGLLAWSYLKPLLKTVRICCKSVLLVFLGKLQMFGTRKNPVNDQAGEYVAGFFLREVVVSKFE